MSQTSKNESGLAQSEQEEAVGQFLRSNQDYFLRHPDILANLKLRHPTSGEAVSLLEYQVKMLRGQNEELRRQLRELVELARENDALVARLQRLSIALLGCRNIDQVLDTAQDMLRLEFKMDGVKIMLRRDKEERERTEFIPPSDYQFEALCRQFADGKPVCGAYYTEQMSRYLFGDEYKEVRSSAQIPLFREPLKGILNLSSRDPNRFSQKMGTVFLGYLGEIMTTALSPYMTSS